MASTMNTRGSARTLLGSTAVVLLYRSSYAGHVSRGTQSDRLTYPEKSLDNGVSHKVEVVEVPVDNPVGKRLGWQLLDELLDLLMLANCAYKNQTSPTHTL
jgi:hypothetical protein